MPRTYLGYPRNDPATPPSNILAPLTHALHFVRVGVVPGEPVSFHDVSSDFFDVLRGSNVKLLGQGVAQSRFSTRGRSKNKDSAIAILGSGARTNIH